MTASRLKRVWEISLSIVLLAVVSNVNAAQVINIDVPQNVGIESLHVTFWVGFSEKIYEGTLPYNNTNPVQFVMDNLSDGYHTICVKALTVNTEGSLTCKPFFYKNPAMF